MTPVKEVPAAKAPVVDAPPAGVPVEGAGPATATRTAWIVLAVLTAINLFNYLDRFVLPAVLEDIRKSGLTDRDLKGGMLGTAFIVVYSLAAPFFGSYGDRRNRPRLLAAGVAIWSVFTALSALAPNFWSLLTARAGVGIGEAAYATIAPALLSDYFPMQMRGRILSIFYAAMPVGAALGMILGGAISQRYGWQAAFLVTGLPGFLLAIAAWRLPESAHRTVSTMAPSLDEYRELLRNRPYVRVVLGYAAYTFGLGGIAIWMSTYLQRQYGFTEQYAGITLGAMTAATGFLGAIVGGWLGDRVLRRWREGYLWVSGASALLAAPFAVWAFLLPSSQFWYPLFVAELLIFMSTGPINSSILNLVRPSIRAASMALSIIAIHLLGDGPSPTILGQLSDRTSMSAAVMIIPASIGLGGLIWLYAAWRGERAPTPVGAP